MPQAGRGLIRAVKAGVSDGARYFELYEENISNLPRAIQTVKDLINKE